MIMGTSLIEHRARPKEIIWRKLAWALCAEEMSSHRSNRAGCCMGGWQWINVEDGGGKAAQRQLEHQLRPGLITVCLR